MNTDVFKLPHAWVEVIAAFLIMFTTCGVCYSYGVFLIPIINDFGWSRGAATVVVLFAGLAYAATVPLTGILADKYGFRWVLVASASCLSLGLIATSQIHSLWELYLFTGAIIGLSMGASFALPVSVVALWFNRRQGLAVGIATLGISLGTAVIPSLISRLTGLFNWRIAMLIVGLAAAVVCISSALLMKRPRTGPKVKHIRSSINFNRFKLIIPEPRSNSVQSMTLSEALRTRHFWMLLIIFVFYLSGVGLIMVHVVPYAIDSGFAAQDAAFLITIIGIFGIGGRLIAGWATDRFGVKTIVAGCLVVLAAITGVIDFLHIPQSLYIFAALFGFTYSVIATIMVRMAKNIFGPRELGSIFGILMVSDGIGFGFVPTLAGYIFDITGSYRTSLLLVSAGFAAASLMTAVEIPKDQRH